MKIQRISQFQGYLQFPSFEQSYIKHLTTFSASDLCKIHEAIPWDKLIKLIGLRDYKKGPKSKFSPKGKLALMFLKHYACCSDRKLIDQLNANIHYQIFCDIYIPPGQGLKNFKMVSEIRTEVGQSLDIRSAQHVLSDHWRSYINDLNSISCDATCYESFIRYPTDIKLLWESVTWTYLQLRIISKKLGQRMLRTKYKKWSHRYSNYCKMRKKTRKRAIPLNRALLKLLYKINTELKGLEEHVECEQPLRYWKRRQTIEQIYEQQSQKFYENRNPKHRIVSIDKPYIRPIVRGKEVKKVEFGAKVHKLQIGGISFIEHLSFEAFNEGTRLQKTIYTSQQLTHTKVRLLGADGIYATNANRRYVTSKSIRTDFKRKGKPSKHKVHQKQLSKMITKERASRLEGSFGTDKEHFLLNRIKARSELNEKLWIFLGIHTSNALKIGRRMDNQRAVAA